MAGGGTNGGVRPGRHKLVLDDLIRYDDLLADALVDHTHFWTVLRKIQDNYRSSPLIKQDDIVAIIHKYVISDNDVPTAMDKLLKSPGIAPFYLQLETSRMQDDFTAHMKRYLDIWRPDCSFEVTTTNRFTLDNLEAAVVARKDITKGHQIPYLIGAQVEITEEQDSALKAKGRDFSVVVSMRSGKHAIFLGPARFANHDCAHNAKLEPCGHNMMMVVAIKNIPAGEEITVAYADSYFDAGNIACLCETCEELLDSGWAQYDENNQRIKPKAVENDDAKDENGHTERVLRQTRAERDYKERPPTPSPPPQRRRRRIMTSPDASPAKELLSKEIVEDEDEDSSLSEDTVTITKEVPPPPSQTPPPKPKKRRPRRQPPIAPHPQHGSIFSAATEAVETWLVEDGSTDATSEDEDEDEVAEVHPPRGLCSAAVSVRSSAVPSVFDALGPCMVVGVGEIIEDDTPRSSVGSSSTARIAKRTSGEVSRSKQPVNRRRNDSVHPTAVLAGANAAIPMDLDSDTAIPNQSPTMVIEDKDEDENDQDADPAVLGLLNSVTAATNSLTMQPSTKRGRGRPWNVARKQITLPANSFYTGTAGPRPVAPPLEASPQKQTSITIPSPLRRRLRGEPSPEKRKLNSLDNGTLLTSASAAGSQFDDDEGAEADTESDHTITPSRKRRKLNKPPVKQKEEVYNNDVDQEDDHRKQRTPGDYILTPLLLPFKTSSWKSCTRCCEYFVEPEAHDPQSCCPRCVRHAKLFGTCWPDTYCKEGEKRCTNWKDVVMHVKWDDGTAKVDRSRGNWRRGRRHKLLQRTKQKLADIEKEKAIANGTWTEAKDDTEEKLGEISDEMEVDQTSMSARDEGVETAHDDVILSPLSDADESAAQLQREMSASNDSPGSNIDAEEAAPPVLDDDRNKMMIAKSTPQPSANDGKSRANSSSEKATKAINRCPWRPDMVYRCKCGLQRKAIAEASPDRCNLSQSGIDTLVELLHARWAVPQASNLLLGLDAEKAKTVIFDILRAECDEGQFLECFNEPPQTSDEAKKLKLPFAQGRTIKCPGDRVNPCTCGLQDRITQEGHRGRCYLTQFGISHLIKALHDKSYYDYATKLMQTPPLKEKEAKEIISAALRMTLDEDMVPKCYYGKPPPYDTTLDSPPRGTTKPAGSTLRKTRKRTPSTPDDFLIEIDMCQWPRLKMCSCGLRVRIREHRGYLTAFGIEHLVKALHDEGYKHHAAALLLSTATLGDEEQTKEIIALALRMALDEREFAKCYDGVAPRYNTRRVSRRVAAAGGNQDTALSTPRERSPLPGTRPPVNSEVEADHFETSSSSSLEFLTEKRIDGTRVNPQTIPSPVQRLRRLSDEEDSDEARITLASTSSSFRGGSVRGGRASGIGMGMGMGRSDASRRGTRSSVGGRGTRDEPMTLDDNDNGSVGQTRMPAANMLGTPDRKPTMTGPNGRPLTASQVYGKKGKGKENAQQRDGSSTPTSGTGTPRRSARNHG